MSQVSLIKGYIFAERYQIVRRVASGGMGAVYEVTHLETNRRRALKVMHAHTLQSEEMRERFRLEARVAASIESEHIVDVFDAGVDAATQMPFLVMELLRGQDLGKLLQKRKHFTFQEVHTYLRQVASALDKTHRANVVHRDLKPANLFLTEREDGAPWIKVLDFGIAKVIAEDTAELNSTKGGVGTPLYMAPEQFRPDYQVTPATDIFALGMVTFTLLVGYPYWREESRRSEGNLYLFASEVMRGPNEPATARAWRAGVKLPDSFDRWFAKATAFSPRLRFFTAGDMVMALAVALGLSTAGADAATTDPFPAITPPPEVQSQTIDPQVTPKAPNQQRGRQWMVGVGAALGVLALGGTGVVLLGRPGMAADEGQQATITEPEPAPKAPASGPPTSASTSVELPPQPPPPTSPRPTAEPVPPPTPAVATPTGQISARPRAPTEPAAAPSPQVIPVTSEDPPIEQEEIYPMPILPQPVRPPREEGERVVHEPGARDSPTTARRIGRGID